jgi:hypothetical protein
VRIFRPSSATLFQHFFRVRHRCMALLIVTAAANNFAHASDAIRSKTLKSLTITASAAIWKIDRDGLDGDGDPEFAIDHLATDGDISVTISELKHLLLAASHTQVWEEHSKIMKRMFKNFKEVSVPTVFKPPTGYKCNASESSLIDTPSLVNVFCTNTKSRTQILLHVHLLKSDMNKHIADVNALMDTIVWK